MALRSAVSTLSRWKGPKPDNFSLELVVGALNGACQLSVACWGPNAIANAVATVEALAEAPRRAR